MPVLTHPASSGRPRRAHGDRGTALALMPAAVLVLFMLAAIAADNALSFVAQRELFHQAEGAANDASIAALNLPGARAKQSLTLDANAAETIIEGEIPTGRHGGYTVVSRQATVNPDNGDVTVVVQANVNHVFLQIFGQGTESITVTAVAHGHRNDQPIN
jgi:hypothetical protein